MTRIARRSLIAALSLLALLVLVYLFAWLILPGIVRTQAERAGSEALHRKLAIEAVHIRPLTLGVTLQGVRLYEADGSTVFAGFERLDVQASWASVLHLAPVVREIHLTGPEVHWVRTAPGHFNTDDIVAALQARPAPAPAPASSAPPRFAVHNIRIEGGRFDFDDQVLKERHAVTGLALGIPFVSTFAAEEEVFVEPRLAATIDGAPLAVTGKALPFTSVPQYAVDLDFDNVDLVRYLDYLPPSAGLRLDSGHLDLHAHVAARLPKGATPQLQASGKVALHALDLAPAPGRPRLKVAELVLEVAQLEIPAGRLEAALTVNGAGRVSLAGDLALSPLHLAADYAIDNLDLLPAWPLAADRVNLRLTRAILGGKGHLAFDQPADGPLSGRVQGDIGLARLATVDAINSNDFVNWDALNLKGLDVRLAPLALHVDEIQLRNFFARIIVSPDGRLNVQDIVRGKAEARRSLTDASPTAAVHAAPAPAPAPASSAPPLPITIGKVAVQGGHVRFTDNFIKPRYSADLADVGGSVTGLSSDAAASANVDLKGKVNEAPLRIAGTLNPLRADPSLDIRASVHDMELAPLTAYSTKYVGYRIERGKLSFDVAYQLESRQLHAENHLVLDQLTFGERVESPSATSLPVLLAVALLKDRNGVIDIDLPIGGSLDDPEFSVGGVILHVLVNLVEKAVTAPFALLGSLFGSDSGELSWAGFNPGQAAITDATEQKLRTLAKALTERPGLKLDIAGTADPAADRDGLAQARLNSRLRGLKRRDLAARGAPSGPGDVTVAPEEYDALLTRAYHDLPAVKGAEAAKAEKAAPPDRATMEQALKSAEPISDDDLIGLGNRRAQAAKAWLVTTGQIAEERLSLVAAHLAVPGKDEGTRVNFDLH